MIVRRDIVQGSLEWMTARAGIPTASEFDALLTPLWKVKTGDGPQTYLARKVAEAWLGGPLAGFASWDTDQGHFLEDEAIPWYEFEFSEKVERVGLVTTDDGLVGCSPDGLIAPDGGIEIKCPQPHTHTAYLLAGEVPKEYLAQIHGAMFVTGAKWWRFLSYRRNFPPLLLTVMRDEEIQDKIAEALALFLGKFKLAMEKLEALNGGPNLRRVQAAEPTPEPQQDSQADLIP